MHQVLQSLKTGAIEVAEVPAPGVRPGHLQIRTRYSLISAGTERMLVNFGKASLLNKVRQQPDKVRQVLEKARTDGIGPTIESVRAKLDQPIPSGYCNVGEIIAVGDGVTGFAIGDRVLSNGAHAEIVTVPHTLCALIPERVSDEAAAFGVLGAIGLQGIRLAAPTLGENFVVIGLGLIGLLTVQLLRANGCRVLGIDMNADRLALARRWGAETLDAKATPDVVAAATAFARGRGVDGVLIAASTTSNDPMRDAARMCRKRGRIVLVGVTGLELSRADFYEKELSFQVSCSYGPGRYDPEYEAKGRDYPVGFVRWTEQRNFEAVLDMMTAGNLDTEPLISETFDIEQASRAYDRLDDPSVLGLLLRYPAVPARSAGLPSRTIALRPVRDGAPVRIAMFGAGNYASRVLAPAFRAAGAELVTVVANTGSTAGLLSRALDAAAATTDSAAALSDPAVNTVVVATRHDSHARFVLEALAGGRNVFVEKPLALTAADVDAIEEAMAAGATQPLLTVGYNRRFSPLVEAMMPQLSAGPKVIAIMVNAGAIPGDHWTQDASTGGGRIAGEACHFIDLARYIARSPIVDVHSDIMGVPDGRQNFGDTATIVLRFADGSIATIAYLANGTKSFPKERVEVFDGGRIFAIDNFRRLVVHGDGTGRRLMQQDKGQKGLVARFVKAITEGGEPPIPLDEIFEVARATLAAAGIDARR